MKMNKWLICQNIYVNFFNVALEYLFSVTLEKHSLIHADFLLGFEMHEEFGVVFGRLCDFVLQSKITQ